MSEKTYRGNNNIGMWVFTGIVENRKFKEGKFTQYDNYDEMIFQYIGKFINGVREDMSGDAEYKENWPVNIGGNIKILYKGEFKRNLKSGRGKLTIFDYNGKRTVEYEGEFKRDKFNGKGIKIKYTNGNQYQIDEVYKGDWVNGEFTGSGEFIKYENGAINNTIKGIWQNGILEREIAAVETIPLIRRIRKRKPDFLQDIELPPTKLRMQKPDNWSKWQKLSYNLSQDLNNKDFRELFDMLSNLGINDLDNLVRYSSKYPKIYNRILQLQISEYDLNNIDIMRNYNKKIAIKNVLAGLLAESMIEYEMERLQVTEKIEGCTNEPIVYDDWSEADPRTIVTTEIKTPYNVSKYCFDLNDLYDENNMKNTITTDEYSLFRDSMKINPFTNSKWDDEFIQNARNKRLAMRETIKLGKLHELEPVDGITVENLETNNLVDVINYPTNKYFLPVTLEWFKLRGNRRIDALNELEDSNLANANRNLSIHRITNEINQSYTYLEFLAILKKFIDELPDNYEESGKYLIKQILEDIINNNDRGMDQDFQASVRI